MKHFLKIDAISKNKNSKLKKKQNRNAKTIFLTTADIMLKNQ